MLKAGFGSASDWKPLPTAVGFQGSLFFVFFPPAPPSPAPQTQATPEDKDQISSIIRLGAAAFYSPKSLCLGLPGTFLCFDPVKTKTFEVEITLLSGVFDSFFLKAHPLRGKEGDEAFVWNGQFHQLDWSIGLLRVSGTSELMASPLPECADSLCVVKCGRQ